jgi:copper transport protein
LNSALRRAAGLAAVCLAAACVAAPSALAHAAFLSASPAAGARVESSPSEVVLTFTEPLQDRLSEATLVDVATGDDVPVSVLVRDKTLLVVRPRSQLSRAAYRVEWHTVSTRDGHALEGSVGFGVGVPAAGGAERVEQSPLARGGWVRVAMRFALYASLLYFAGGVLCAAALGRRGDPASWLVPRAAADGEERSARAWRRTIDAGLVASSAAVGVALVEAADAGGGLGASELTEFLLTNIAGYGRVATVLLLALAVALATTRAAAAALLLLLAFVALAVSGHANSADPRLPAIVADWAHLVAGAVWAGGIGQIAATWLGPGAGGLRRDLLTEVLPRFGRLALPAFFAVAATGVASGLIELGEPSALWSTGYGQVLMVKIALVALVAAASWAHAMRLRPRLVAANPHPPAGLAGAHRRLMRAELPLLAGVLGAAALLVVFPLPPRQFEETAAADPAAAACSPCPQPPPEAGELAVAAQAGSRVAAVRMRREGGALRGELRVLDRDGRPDRGPAGVDGARTRSCGTGCVRFDLPADTSRVTVSTRHDGGVHRATLPAVWAEGGEQRARTLLARAQRTMRSLRSVREEEVTSSGPGERAVVRYRLAAPDRAAWRSDRGAETIVIGNRQWLRVGDSAWRQAPYSGGGSFRFRGWFRWTAYARSVRLLSERDGVAQVALFDEATPAWFRLRIDTRTLRVLESRAVAPTRFIVQRYSHFDRPLRIEPPEDAR